MTDCGRLIAPLYRLCELGPDWSTGELLHCDWPRQAGEGRLMSEWGSGMTVDRKEPPKIRTRTLEPAGLGKHGSRSPLCPHRQPSTKTTTTTTTMTTINIEVSMGPGLHCVPIDNQNKFWVLPCIPQYDCPLTLASLLFFTIIGIIFQQSFNVFIITTSSLSS